MDTTQSITNREHSATVFSTTGITGAPGQEIGRREIVQWVRNYADSDTLRMLDIAAYERMDTLADEQGSLCGVMDACKTLMGAA